MTAILPASPDLPMPDFLLDSSHFEVLRVAGADAERFLQGQVTCDAGAVTIGNFSYGAACNNKGRVIAPFLLYRDEHDFLMVFQAGLAALFTGTMKKFLPFYKCTMSVDTSLRCWGLIGASLPPQLALQGWSLPAAGQTIVLPAGWIARMTGEHPQYVLCTMEETLQSQPGSMSDSTAAGAWLQWQACSMRNGFFPFVVSDSELYTPQELGFEQKGYVSFTKGCYTGQEIIARMHYRGKLKRKLYRIEFSCENEVEAKTLALLQDDGSLLVECQKFIRLPDQTCLALAMLPVELADQDIELQTSAGPKVRLQPF
jgi:folate-binding protein YgfZ